MSKPQLYSMPCGCKLCSSTDTILPDPSGKVDFKVWFEMCPMHERAGEMRALLYRIEGCESLEAYSYYVEELREFLKNLAEEEKKKAEKFSTS